ncbi:hypothetical protein L3049_06035 [Labilibaculum sp. DW002]|uniref:Polysaccharide biosynthesis protein n=1 Tax=Paralabilibaculum antarcticum TaxID=2912572 RepID=A0ABT5VQ47_9BACT|nr:hypothetical protein [Labilibaculum sp. DW002]MDE5417562.1 hypothetical protein [Labilibaculum sp. DW002]
MKNYKAKMQAHPQYAKVLHWGKLISITGLAQVLVQAVGFISGILVIRLLPVEEYALYTLANTMLGTMTVLADGGISSGVMAQGGKVWQDKEKLGAVLATGLDLRKKFAIVSLLVSIPILLYLLLDHGASWLTATLIVISLIPAFFAALSDSLLQIVPKLHQNIGPLQRNQVEVGVGRLALTGLTIFIFPFTFVALLASGLPRIYGNIQLKKITAPFVISATKPDPVIRKEILAIVKRILPSAIYYCLSGQITIWLISIFGDTAAIAQLGALGRFLMLFVLLGVLIDTLFVPRFARMPNNKKKIINSFLKINLFLFFICIVFGLIFIVLKDQLLWILGPDYANLSKEFVLMMISGCMAFTSSAINKILSSRGIVIPALLFIISAIGVQLITAFFVPLGEVYGVILFSLYTTLVIYLIRIIYFFNYIKNVQFDKES